MSSVAIIPARGGSKRIPRKNVKEFIGRPIIAYSIEAAIKSGVFDEVCVSTDDSEIAELAVRYGAHIPFMRTSDTANDYATTADVIKEVLGMYGDRGRTFDSFCCIYATAPFVTAERLREGAALLDRGDFDSAFTCTAYSYPIQRSLVIDEKGRIAMKWPEFRNSRSQDLPTTYHDAGQFYFSKTEAFIRSGTLWNDNTAPIILSEAEVQDLDTLTDWAMAELKYKSLHP